MPDIINFRRKPIEPLDEAVGSDGIYIFTLFYPTPMIAFRQTFFLMLMLCLVLSVHAERYFLTLYTIPSRTQIDFSTPRRMARTAFGNALTLNFGNRKNAIGHVFIELEGGKESIMVGATKLRMFYSGRKELMEGYGLGILFLGIEGRLHFDDEVKRDLPTQYHFGDVAFIRAEISRGNYERLMYYLEEYQRRGYSSIYNGLNRPREGLGAGCTAFGVSFFEVAGILQPAWEENWTVNVRIPHKLVGGPLTGNIVPLLEVFLAKTWAAEDEPHLVFSIIDPYLIYDWINKIWEQLTGDTVTNTEPQAIRATPVLRKKARGLFYDFSDAPVPDEAVFFTPTEASE